MYCLAAKRQYEEKGIIVIFPICMTSFSNARWRAHAAAAVASRERKERLAAEQAMAASSSAAARAGAAAAVSAGGATRPAGLARSTADEDNEGAREYEDKRGAAAGSATTVLAPSAEYEGVYGDGGGGGLGGGFGGGGYGGGQIAVGTPIERRGHMADGRGVVGAGGSSGYSTSAALAASAVAAAAEAATQQQAQEAQNAARQTAVGVGEGQRKEQVRRRASTIQFAAATEEAAARKAEHQQSSGSSRVSMGAAAATAAAAAAAATTAATAAATAAAEADDAARRSWEAQEQQLQLSRLAAERSQLERRVADAENAAATAAAVGQGRDDVTHCGHVCVAMWSNSCDV